MHDVSKVKPKIIPFKCPNCGGYGKVGYAKNICHSCNGKGYVTVKQEEEDDNSSDLHPNLD